MSLLTSRVVALVFGYLGGIYFALAYIYYRKVLRAERAITLAPPERQRLTVTLGNAAFLLVVTTLFFAVRYLREHGMSFDLRYALGGMLLGVLGGVALFNLGLFTGRRKG